MQVVITGMGVVSPLGWGQDTNLRGLVEGQDPVGPITRFDTDAYASGIGAQVPDLPDPPEPRRLHRAGRYALHAAREALEQAGLEATGGLVVGGSTAGMFEAESPFLDAAGVEGLPPIHPRALLQTALASTADLLLERLPVSGPVCSLSAACSGGAHALVEGATWIEDGLVGTVLVGASDSLCRLTLAGFNSLGLVSTDRPRPFDSRRSGMVLGEGAAFFVLEAEEAARARGARIVARLAGYGCVAEGHHLVHPDASGAPAARAMELALSRAGRSPSDVDFVSAHGTATRLNDSAESAALVRVFGELVPPVSSSKGQVGHSLGASGAIEAAFCLLAMEHGVFPPNLGFADPDPECPVPVVGDPGRRGDIRLCLSSSFAFGGNDVALLLAAGEGA